MTYVSSYQIAIAEAKRFIERAERATNGRTENAYVMGADNAAAKRASMDLTKALAELRRN